jgi:carotenoid cleavage dioxygenase
MDLSAFPYLQGNYAPVDTERDFTHEQLRIEGTLPANLRGAFMRNGANVAFQPNHYVYPLDGDGMIHAVYLANGKAHYRNRWVKTRHLMTERRFGRMIYGSVGRMLPVPQEVIDAGGEPNPMRNTANTNVLAHGGKLLAMWEGGFPHLMTPGLDTVGLYDYEGGLRPGDAFSAHPKICPDSGEMVTATQRWDDPLYTLRFIDRDGHLRQSIRVDIPDKAIIHDLQITENHVVIFYPPAFHSVAKAMRGEDPFEWRPQDGARIFVVRRDGGGARVFETGPFFSWHFCNAFESGDSIHVDYVWIRTMPFGFAQGSGVEKQMRNLHRMTLDLRSGAVTDQELSATHCEFARCDDRVCGKRYRLGYATASNRAWDDAHGYNCTLSYDLESGKQQLWEYGQAANAGEPVHVADPSSPREEDGYLMCFVNNPGEGAFLSILRAGRVGEGPVAKVHIPSRVPNGFHANWMQDLRLGS